MATIERKPLPPFNSAPTKITEADRAEIIARANDVIDYYLNGPGSYFDAGPRKPLPGEGDTTVVDLNRFLESVIAAKQFADDPGDILESVADVIRRTIDRVQKADRDQEGKDNISRPPPPIDDPIDDPRVTSLRQSRNAPSYISLPVQVPPASPSQAGATARFPTSKSIRILSGRPATPPPESTLDVNIPARSLSSSTPSTGVVGAPQTDPSNIRVLSSPYFAPDGSPLQPNISNQTPYQSRGPPVPNRQAPLMLFGLPDQSAASGNDMNDWRARWIPVFRQ